MTTSLSTAFVLPQTLATGVRGSRSPTRIFAYSANTWHHIVTVVVPTGYTIYADGSQIGSATWPSDAPILYDSNHVLNIGSDLQNAGEGFYGTLDETRVSKIARSADWIATEYNNESSPSTFYSINSPSPSITSVNPSSGGPGAIVQVVGKDFGSSQGSSTVTINGTSVGNPSGWSDGLIAFTLPTGLSRESSITVGGVSSNTVPFTVLATPYIQTIRLCPEESANR